MQWKTCSCTQTPVKIPLRTSEAWFVILLSHTSERTSWRHVSPVTEHFAGLLFPFFFLWQPAIISACSEKSIHIASHYSQSKAFAQTCQEQNGGPDPMSSYWHWRLQKINEPLQIMEVSMLNIYLSICSSNMLNHLDVYDLRVHVRATIACVSA